MLASQACALALKELMYTPAGEEPGASDVSDTLGYLNRMLWAWLNDGVDVGMTVDLVRTDELPTDARFDDAVVAMLAKAVSPTFNMPVAAVTQQRALDGWQAIQAYYIATPDAEFDKALTRLPSRRWPYSVPSDT